MLWTSCRAVIRNIKGLIMHPNHLLQATLAGIAGLAMAGANAAGFYLVEVGTPASLGTAGVV